MESATYLLWVAEDPLLGLSRPLASQLQFSALNLEGSPPCLTGPPYVSSAGRREICGHACYRCQAGTMYIAEVFSVKCTVQLSIPHYVGAKIFGNPGEWI